MNNTKLIVGTFLFLITISAITPIVLGYGTDIGTAETLTAGTHNDTLDELDLAAYYKIALTSGQLVTVVLVDTPTFDLDLYIFGPGYSSIAESTSSTDTNEVQFSASEGSGDYYIKVYRFSGSGDATFVLTITINTVPIPGFELIYAIFGILGIISMIIILKYKKIGLLKN